MTNFLNGHLDPKQDLSTESGNKQILGTDSISTLIQSLMEQKEATTSFSLMPTFLVLSENILIYFAERFMGSRRSKNGFI